MSHNAIFIDGAYLDKVLELCFDRTRIDFVKLAESIYPTRLLRTYYYHCLPHVTNEPTEDEMRRFKSKEGFFTALSMIPRFEVQLGRLVYRGKNENGKPIYIQKLVDVMLSVEMVQLAATKQITKLALVAGDNDFLPAVKAAKAHGVLVTLIHGPPTNGFVSNHELWGVADERVELNWDLVNSIRRIRDDDL
jgi:uncharacterized LabA/DUF88 family protein